MADARSAGTAAEAYAVDFNHYPAAAGFPTGLVAPTATMGTTFQGQVVPTYIRVLPLVDGWSSFFLYGGDATFQQYAIVSNGKDGTGGGIFVGTSPETTNFNDDIIFCNGQFIQYPQGAQN
ncbi:MAG: type II secretion system protein GspG [Thermoanaerobaculia bacterium]|nr:type II secretion system protein GspG [Thermoanaerobaculia bacterium]